MPHSKTQQLIQKLAAHTEWDYTFNHIINNIPSYTSQYIECRLDGNPQLDYLYCIDTQEELDDYPILANDKEKIQSLIHQFPEIPYLWLEYDDINKLKNKKMQSCWHACVYPDYLKFPRQQTQSLTADKVIAILRHLAHDPLLGCSRLKRLVDHISHQTTLVHISYMKARQPQAVKFFVKIPANKLYDFLAAIQWPGDIQNVKRLLRKKWLYTEEDGTLSLDLKWEKTLTPYLGIVFSKINFTNNTLGAMRISSLIEEDVIIKDHHIHSVIAWLGQKNKEESHWIDIKTLIDDRGEISSKLYFGSQNTLQAITHKLLPSHFNKTGCSTIHP